MEYQTEEGWQLYNTTIKGPQYPLNCNRFPLVVLGLNEQRQFISVVYSLAQVASGNWTTYKSLICRYQILTRLAY